MSTFEKKYVQWVQRTLNRELDAEIVTSGDISPEYREAVETFQLIHDLKVTGDVGPSDQNRMIKTNHKSVNYVNWLQESLRAAGVDPSLAITGTIDRKTSDCIKSFQAFHDLKDDGWVGARTETQLVEVTGILPAGHIRRSGPVVRRPRHYGNPKPKTISLPLEHQVTRLISSNYYEVLYNRSAYSATDRKQRLCVLGKLKQRHGIKDRFPVGSRLSFAYNGSSVYRTPGKILMSAREFLSGCMAAWSPEKRMDSTAGRVLISDLIKVIRDGLNSVDRYGSTFGASKYDYFPGLLSEVTKIVEQDRQSPNSILSCFKK